MDSAGYALVELLVLITVISVLAAIGFPLYLSYARAQETDGAARVIVVSLNQADSSPSRAASRSASRPRRTRTTGCASARA